MHAADLVLQVRVDQRLVYARFRLLSGGPSLGPGWLAQADHGPD
jgi:hypothetical protein